MNKITLLWTKFIFLTSITFTIQTLPPSDSFTSLIPAPKLIIETPKVADVKPIKPATSVPKERTIKLHNSITNDMLKKKHLLKTFTPTKLIIYVNGKEFKKDETMSIIMKDNKLTISFDYEFLDNKKYSGTHEVTFELDPAKNEFDLTFTWNGKQHLLIDGAEAISIK